MGNIKQYQIKRVYGKYDNVQNSWQIYIWFRYDWNIVYHDN